MSRLADGASRWLLPPLVGGLLAVVLFPPLAPVLLGVACFVAWFFRDPSRSPAVASVSQDTTRPADDPSSAGDTIDTSSADDTTTDTIDTSSADDTTTDTTDANDGLPASAVLAPADGRVTVLRTDGDRVRVGVFMSPFDVHVTRVPASGDLVRLDHRPGGHWPAFSKASDRNERVEFAVESPVGRLDGAMIAGTVARRARAYHAPGDHVRRGDRLGLIAFGSRTDLVFPPHVDPADVRVAPGDRVRAGETVLFAPDG